MITEDYVSFETACLLKDKGFDQKCEKVYMQGELKWASCCMEGESSVDREDIRLAANYKNWIEYTQGDYAVLAPTLNIALKWLREIYSLEIYPYHDFPKVGDKWWFEIIKYPNSVSEYESETAYNTYEEACDAAIKHCLENLI